MAQNQEAWSLINKLCQEALGMTGDEVQDVIIIERGAQWVRDFKLAFPMFAQFVEILLMGTPEQTLRLLQTWQPSTRDWSPQQNVLAKEFLGEVQKRLRP